VFAGRITRSFELLDEPPWADDYLNIRRDQELSIEEEEASHVADVAQCWRVDRFRPLPFTTIPAWIRKSFFGRSTYGRIYAPDAMGLEPFAVLDALIDRPRQSARESTLDLAEIERRLVTDVGPAAFEHLCVALLQLEHPKETWAHIGGSGDGGVDGIGAGEDGKVTGVLQCKWSYWGEEVEFATPWGRTKRNSSRRILASLLHPVDVEAPAGVHFWSRQDIARLVLKHASRLPAAVSLRIAVTE
jgi:hypothetical protein